MMQFRALVLDCFRDALDRKLFWVMTGISAMMAVVMACVSFDETGVHFLFGLRHFETDIFAPGHPEGRGWIGLILTKYIGEYYIGWIGIIIALVGTCGIFPSMMERGAIDVLLAKPLSRPTLFLGKYLGAMAFVFIQAAIFVVLTFLVAGWRWNYWSVDYLWCIPLIVLLFSYVFCFTALFGVITRSAMSSLLLSIVAWIGIAAPQIAHETLVGLPAVGMEVDPRWVRAAEIAKTVVPKTRDVTWIAAKLIKANLTADVPTEVPSSPPGPGERSASGPSVFAPDVNKIAEVQIQIGDVAIARSIVTSLIFQAVIVAIAMWKFSRRDF
jgi:ABC-type transport system involved in multi-copper enzyme maturation permease subunit